MPSNLRHLAPPEPEGVSSKLGSQIVRRLEAEILDAGWIRGRRLGGEEELARRFGVSRAIMREAAAMAELNGLVESRRGHSGGLFVAASAQWVAVSTLRHYLVLSGTASSEINEIRFLVQRRASMFAMRNMDPQSALRLRSLLQVRSDNFRDLVRSQRLALGEIHRLAGLRTLGLFELALGESSLDQLLWTGASKADVARLAAAVWDVRRRQVEAIIAADPVAALRAQQRILSLYQREHQRLARFGRVGEASPGGVESRSLAFMRDDLVPMKKPEAVARVIARRIVESRARAGERIGSEQDIMRDLEVSRGVVREAVRSLERHGIVVLERGFAGGIHVGRPAPDEAVRVARMYLSRELQGDQSAVLHVALALQMMAAEFAARRAQAEDASLFERLAQFSAQIEVEPANPRTQLISNYLILAELSGSRVLDCLMRILVDHVEVRVDEARFDDQMLRESQRGLVGAIANGDAPLARRYLLATHKASGVESPPSGYPDDL